MNKSIYDFKRKYAVQDELLNEGALDGLDERTLHETIKAMLVNTTKDCIKYGNWMDPDMTEITKLLVKENKTEDDMHKIKNAQDRLRNSLHFAQISENSLYTLIYQMLLSEDIKRVFKQEIPLMYNDLYYLIDMEDEIAESIEFSLSELYESPSFKEICSLINETIDDFIENAEEYIENVKERDLYEQFVSCREQYRKSRCICKLRNRRINNNSKPM